MRTGLGGSVRNDSVLWSHGVKFAPDTGSAAATRRFVEGCLRDHDLRYLVDDVRLVASELATNAACHTRTKFTVVLEGTTDEVLLTVSDGAASLPVVRAVNHSATEGRGMHIVKHYSRAWGVVEGSSDTKAVWASFGLR
jgi:anti-sigma regulatory factor (Ser/Thr protein kinase)